MMEPSLPTQAFYQGRRSGIDWAFERERYIANVGYFFESDLQGNNKGDTAAFRLAWTPRKAAGDVLHLGIAAAQERPDREVNGLGVTVHPSVRWRAKPEATLTPYRFINEWEIRTTLLGFNETVFVLAERESDAALRDAAVEALVQLIDGGFGER